MITSDDRLFCLLFSAESGISVKRLNCYNYILQNLGFSLDYSFRINVSGVRSKNFSRYLEEQVSTGLIIQKNGIIMLNSDSLLQLGSFVLFYNELTTVDTIKSILDKLSDDELYLVCVVNIIMEDLIKSKGVDALVSSRDFIEQSVENLCSEYSKENFNLAISLLSKLKKECFLNE